MLILSNACGSTRVDYYFCILQEPCIFSVSIILYFIHILSAIFPLKIHTHKTFAEELNSLVGDAFRMAFASQLQPSAPLWSKELSSDCGGMGVRAPDSLPGLTHHYPHCGD
ncbi:hypothetical protein ABMA27_001141, partial [Loxostege sticticalis]